MRLSKRSILTAGIALTAVSSVKAGPLPVSLTPDAVRTYCMTEPLKKQTTATHAAPNPAGNIAYTDDNNANTAEGYAAAWRATDVVWRVIGTFGANEGEGYCGYVGIPPTAIGARANYADGIQDCVTAVRFNISSSGYKSASLHWEGSNLAYFGSLAVSTCKYDSPFNFDLEGPDADGDGFSDTPDCIIDADDFGAATFASIKDVQNRKAEVGGNAIGTVNNVDFGDLFPVRDISLSDRGLGDINAAAGGSVVFLIRCGDEQGRNNGANSGSVPNLVTGSNLFVIHDPAGAGFGFPGTLSLELQ